jgi:mannan endo-1,4-beta-mannosidase
MWCVDSADTGVVPAESYWPGADVVDILGIDAYNGFGPWTSPVGVIGPGYERVAALHPSADLWLAEIGCRAVDPAEPHDKPAWFEELLSSDEFPRLTRLCFFHADKEQDWRITTPGVAETVRTSSAAAQRCEWRRRPFQRGASAQRRPSPSH